MSEISKIEWTEATWNPVRGCNKISPGCTHCYAETFAERFRGVPGHPYEQGFDLRLVPEKLFEPLRWPRPKNFSGTSRRSKPCSYGWPGTPLNRTSRASICDWSPKNCSNNFSG